MEQMVLRAQEQPCRCWRGNRPSGGYCFPFFSPSVLYSSFSVLRTPRIDSELCNSELCSRLSPPGRLPDRSSFSDLGINRALVLLRVVSTTPLPLGPLCGGGGVPEQCPQHPSPTPHLLTKVCPPPHSPPGGCQAHRACVLPPEFPETPGDETFHSLVGQLRVLCGPREYIRDCPFALLDLACGIKKKIALIP